MNMARVKAALGAFVIFLIAIEIFQPRRTNPPAVPSRSLQSHASVPPDVYSALLRSCGDCHSNQTHWPWYSLVAPFSWVVVDDVNEGRRHMNFDDWEALDGPQTANERLADICKEIEEKGMPPYSYRLAHGDLQLNPQELASICSWSQAFRTGSARSSKQP
jgi:hypothetical protein